MLLGKALIAVARDDAEGCGYDVIAKVVAHDDSVATEQPIYAVSVKVDGTMRVVVLIDVVGQVVFRVVSGGLDDGRVNFGAGYGYPPDDIGIDALPVVSVNDWVTIAFVGFHNLPLLLLGQVR